MLTDTAQVTVYIKQCSHLSRLIFGNSQAYLKQTNHETRAVFDFGALCLSDILARIFRCGEVRYGLRSGERLTLCVASLPEKGQIEDVLLPSKLRSRALPDAPDGYTPQGADCPSNRPTVRDAKHLSPNETSWLQIRRNNTVSAMSDLLDRLNITGFDAVSYLKTHASNASALPNVAIAASGGGYRAMLNGAGGIKAFDSREPNSTTGGHLGGLLQSSTYLAGLSGGGWLVGSIMVNNFSTIGSLQVGSNASSVWQLGNSVFEGPDKGSIQVLDSADYYSTIANEVGDKKDAGFQTSVTDFWGRALSFQLINATNGGVDFTWSSIQQQYSFSSGQAPLPILVADGRAPGESLIPGNTTVYEFNPFEMGTWDPTTFGFAPLEFLGSKFDGGSLSSDKTCVRGFDNAGFIMGTSSSLFNQFLLQVNQSSIPELAKKFVTSILDDFGDDDNDIANYTPNPFFNYHNTTSRNANSERLTLVDGGEDNQNIPLHPLIQPNRHVDVIFAIDSSADTPNFYPNGSSLVATYERSLNGTDPSGGNLANGTSFPAIPDTNTFINLGLNTRPTFFGCNSSNTTHITPLIVYIPNFPYVFESNFSTFIASYNTSVRDAVIANGYAAATMADATADSTWPTCVGCAILSRSLERTGTDMPDVCRQCFTRFCWDGRTNSTAPPPHEPTVKGTPINVRGAAAGLRSGGEVVLAACTAALTLGLVSL